MTKKMMTNSITLLVRTLSKDRHLRAHIIRLTLAELQSRDTLFVPGPQH